MLLDPAKDTLTFLSDLPVREPGGVKFCAVSSATKWEGQFGESRPGTVVTICNFDGVHVGHQKILRAVVERAEQERLIEPVATGGVAGVQRHLSHVVASTPRSARPPVGRSTLIDHRI